MHKQTVGYSKRPSAANKSKRFDIWQCMTTKLASVIQKYIFIFTQQ